MGINDILKRLLQTKVVTSVVLTTGATGTYVLYQDQVRYPRMMHCFAHGSVLPPMCEKLHQVTYFRRPELERTIKDLMSSRFTSEYYLLQGAVGSGKSRLLAEVIQDLQAENKGNGAPVYVMATQGRSFSDSLAKAVGFRFDEHVNFRFFIDVAFRVHSFPSREEDHKLVRTLEAIEIAAFNFTEKYGKPVVIVIDGATYLAQHAPHALSELQYKAKLWADTNIAKVIFVSNDAKTEEILQGNSSAWSRAAAPVHIGDLSEEEAIRYLMTPEFMDGDSLNQGGLNQAQAAEVVRLVGRRVYHLVTYKCLHLKGLPHEDIIGELMAREREKFIRVSKKPSQLMIVKSMFKSPKKSLSLADVSSKSSSSDVQDLVNANLIKVHRQKDGIYVTFESRLVEAVVSEQLD